MKNTQFVNYRKKYDNVIVNIDNNYYDLVIRIFNKHHTRVNTETDNR